MPDHKQCGHHFCLYIWTLTVQTMNCDAASTSNNFVTNSSSVCQKNIFWRKLLITVKFSTVSKTVLQPYFQTELKIIRFKLWPTILSLLPSKMCQSRLSWLIAHWVHEKILVSAFCWLAQKNWCEKPLLN